LQVLEGLERLGFIARIRYWIQICSGRKAQIVASAYNFENNDNLAEIQTPPMGTTDFLYLRFIGDRRIREKDFGRIS
jgi:hypothetical protein